MLLYIHLYMGLSEAWGIPSNNLIGNMVITPKKNSNHGVTTFRTNPIHRVGLSTTRLTHPVGLVGKSAGKPDEFHDKNSRVSCRFSLSQSNEHTESWDCHTIYSHQLKPMNWGITVWDLLQVARKQHIVPIDFPFLVDVPLESNGNM